jgi:hypothetical protein
VQCKAKLAEHKDGLLVLMNMASSNGKILMKYFSPSEILQWVPDPSNQFIFGEYLKALSVIVKNE